MNINYAKEIYKHLVTSIKTHPLESDPSFKGLRFNQEQLMVLSWGAHDYKELDSFTLQFEVRGALFKGCVQIIYHLDEDNYEIHFLTQDELGQVDHHKVKGVSLYELHAIIDTYIKYNP